jgi:hypothetical protein
MGFGFEREIIMMFVSFNTDAAMGSRRLQVGFSPAGAVGGLLGFAPYRRFSAGAAKK